MPIKHAHSSNFVNFVKTKREAVTQDIEKLQA